MEKLEENGRKVKDEISQSIERFILELQSRKKCLFEEVDVSVALESNNKHKVRSTIKFTNGDENVVLSAIRNFGVVSAHLQLTSGEDLSPEGVPRDMTGGPPTSGSLLDQSWETDESSSTDNDSIDISDETEMKHLSDTIVMFPQRCLSKCKNVYQGEISSRALSNRQCAIKFPQETDQSKKEVKILEKLGTHTHVLSLIQFGVVDSIFNETFLVLELCCKDNLDQYLRNTSYNLQLSLRYCIQIIEGMKYIHDKFIIHKDLKPSNILLTLDLQRVKIADFGISHEIKSKRSMVFCEYSFGTAGYRPPESFGNAYISLKSDNFSLGALFHYIMSDGKSSFGTEPDLRDSNIIKGNVRIAHLLVPNPNTFSHLFKLMMSKERRYRPTIWQIEDHPCWGLKEHDCKFDYGCVVENDDSSDEGAHSPQVEIVDPIDEFTILSEMLEILEPEEERIHNNKDMKLVSSAEILTKKMESKIQDPVEGGPRTSDTKVSSSARELLRNLSLRAEPVQRDSREGGPQTSDTKVSSSARELMRNLSLRAEPVERVSREGGPRTSGSRLLKPFRSKRQPAKELDAAEALQRYRNKGRVKKYFGTRGSDVGQMHHPNGICSTASDDIVVADSYNHRVQIFDVNGQVKGSFGGEGTAEGQFDHVIDVCVTSRGKIVSSDYDNNRIQIFDEHGKFVRKFGGLGSGDGKLDHPRGVATDDKGLIYVCDCNNNRVQVFTEEGKFVRKFGLNSPHYISVTPNGRVVVTETVNRSLAQGIIQTVGRLLSHHKVAVHVFDSHSGRHLLQVGTLESEIDEPAGVATDEHDNIVVCDEGNKNRVQILTSNGEFVNSFGSKGSHPGQMMRPVGVCVLSDGQIAVSDCWNHRVQIF